MVSACPQSLCARGLTSQAKASDKRIAQANEKALHNLQLGLLIVNVSVILG